MMDCKCINFLSINLRVSVGLLQHLKSRLDILLHYCNSWVNCAFLLLHPHIFPIYLVTLLIAQTIRLPLFCIVYMVIIPRFLWLNAMGLICFSAHLIMEIYWLSQNRVGRFCWTSFTLVCMPATMKPERFILYYIGISSGLIHYCIANRLCPCVAFFRRISPLLSLNLVFCNHYPFQKASLYPGAL